MTRVIWASAACLSLAGAAQAELVTNGGFESGDFSGWTQFGNTGFTGVQGNFAGVDPHSGNFQAYFGPVGSTGGIEQQTLAVPAGATVHVSFWLYNFGGTPNSFAATLDGQALIPSLSDAGQFNYTQFSGNVTTTHANPALDLIFQQNPSYWLLDDVSANVTSVPLPGASILGASGLACVGGFGLLRRRQSSR